MLAILKVMSGKLFTNDLTNYLRIHLQPGGTILYLLIVTFITVVVYIVKSYKFCVIGRQLFEDMLVFIPESCPANVTRL